THESVTEFTLSQWWTPLDDTSKGTLAFGEPVLHPPCSPRILKQENRPKSESFRLPVQLFEMRTLAQCLSEVPDTSKYSLVGIVWLPDELVQTFTLASIIDRIRQDSKLKPFRETDSKTVVLGPQDSDTLALLEDKNNTLPAITGKDPD